jgi:hypothetical protein
MKKGNRLRSQMRQRLTQRKTFFFGRKWLRWRACVHFICSEGLHMFMFDVAMQAQQKSFL